MAKKCHLLALFRIAFALIRAVEELSIEQLHTNYSENKLE